MHAEGRWNHLAEYIQLLRHLEPESSHWKADPDHGTHELICRGKVVIDENIGQLREALVECHAGVVGDTKLHSPLLAIDGQLLQQNNTCRLGVGTRIGHIFFPNSFDNENWKGNKYQF